MDIMRFLLPLLLLVGPGVPRLVPGTAWTWPLAGLPTVVRGFSPPPRPWLAGHRGVDLAGDVGQPVRATGAGVIAFAGLVAGRGVVSVEHAAGLRTTYEPVSVLVEMGQPVLAGEPLGALDAGHPGCPVAACLHWGLRRGELYLDPLLLMRPARVRLKPLADSPPVGWSSTGPAGWRRAGRSPRPGCRSGRTPAGSPRDGRRREVPTR